MSGLETARLSLQAVDCTACGATGLGTRHATDDCGGLLARVGGTWRCLACGTDCSDVGTDCPECESADAIVAIRVALDPWAGITPRAVERAVGQLSDEARRRHGSGTLADDPSLAGVALRHAREMAERGFVGHETPDGEDPVDRYRAAGIPFDRPGENVAAIPVPAGVPAAGVAELLVGGWLDSPGHREVLLDEGFSRLGVGVHLHGDGRAFAVQNFA